MGHYARVGIFILAVGLASGCNWGYLVPPATTYCQRTGGTLERRVDADGGENGYCRFADGSECEQWSYYYGKCKPGDSLAAPADAQPQAGLPNPASVHCEQNAGRLDLRTGSDGGVSGICVFPDGSECEEWAFFRGECRPGASLAAPTDAVSQPGLPNPASVFCEKSGGRLDLRASVDGGQAGICVFPNGKECDEWAYFRGECKPTDGSEDPAGALSLTALQNAAYHSPDWGDYQLVDGVYHRPGALPGESSDIYVTELMEPVAFGDLNGDTLPDAVVFLSTQNGGTGHFREMAAMVNTLGLPENVSTVALGDRVVIEAAQIDAGVITLNMRVQGPDDGMCCPSRSETWRYQLQAGSLVRLP